MQLPARSVWASGLAGLVAWGLSLVFAHFGYTLSPEAITPVVLGAAVVVGHFTPDSLKDQATALNVKVEDLEAWIPTVQDKYPDQ